MVLRVCLIVAVAILAVGVLYAGSRPADAKDKVASRGSESPVAVSSPNSVVTREEAKRALEYWTPKRMASATPAPLPQGSPSPKGIIDQPLPPDGSSPPVRGAAPVPPADHTDNRRHQGGGPKAITPAEHTDASLWTGPSTRPPATTTGKLFFLIDPNTPNDPTDDYESWCSASTVNSAAKNLVFTAGHCLLETELDENNVRIGPWSDARWVRDITYVPDYPHKSSTSPSEYLYGEWTAREVMVHEEWEKSGDRGYDVGAVLLWPSEFTGGERLVDVVGANGIRFNQPAEQDAYAFGYPQKHDNGEFLYYCHDRSKWGGVFNPRITWMKCDFKYGASGGPWLMNFNGEWGDLFSVTSHGCRSIFCDGDAINGPLFDESIRKFYEDIVGADFQSRGRMAYTRLDVGGDGEDYAIYSTSNDIFSESDARKLTLGLGTDINPSYAPAAKHMVAFESNQGDTYNSTSDYEIRTIEVNGTGLPNQVTDNTEDDRDPSYSPDGRQIAYEGYDGNDYEIYTISVSEGKPTGGRSQLTHNTVDDLDPAYSPDGNQIAYISDNEIYKIDATGGTPIRVTHNSSRELDPTYSPDGKWIAFAGGWGDLEIYKVRLSENPQIFHEPIQITYNDTGDRKPSYSPDGYHIVYQSYDGNDHELYTINLIYGHVRQLTHNNWTDCCPSWGG